MKIHTNFTLTIFGFIMLFSVATVHAEVKKKQFAERWPAGSIQTLQIDNRFGEVRISDHGGSNVTIDVVITIEAANERKADELLELIDVKFAKSGNTLSAETIISRNFNTKQRFSIDYEVNVPADKNLKISNRYGNTFVNELTASGDFDIRYGNLNVNRFDTKPENSVRVNLAYGLANLTEAGDITVGVQYSKLNFGTVKNLTLNSKYTVVNIDNVQEVITESRYDTFNFETINSFDANLKYTNVKIGELKTELKLDSGYGGIRIGSIYNDFKSISISNNYGQISLGLANADYVLDAECTYCGIAYPQNKFAGDRMIENNRRTIKGKVGEGKGGSVYLRSRYGEIKLN